MPKTLAQLKADAKKELDKRKTTLKTLKARKVDASQKKKHLSQVKFAEQKLKQAQDKLKKASKRG